MSAEPTARPGAPVVLVVDDTPSLLDMTRACLETEGYRVVTCLESRSALRLAEEHRPAVVMLDLVMPELSGWDVLAQLRADPAHTHTPVIICTAYVGEALARLDELRGPAGRRELGFLPKPYDADELLEVVASVVGRVESH